MTYLHYNKQYAGYLIKYTLSVITRQLKQSTKKIKTKIKEKIKEEKNIEKK